MGNTQSTDGARILPRDVVQITGKNSPFWGLFGTVTAVRNWGLLVSIPRADDTAVPVRVGRGEAALVGLAPICDPEVQKARETLEITMQADPPVATLDSWSYVMQLTGRPDGTTTVVDGHYLEDFDFEAYGGTGNILLTPDIEKAMHFDSLLDAMLYRDRSPQCKPLREDGQPNRPLTATNWALVPVLKGDAN